MIALWLACTSAPPSFDADYYEAQRAIAEGDAARAEAMLSTSVASAEVALGLEHPEVARLLDLLADAYAAEGKDDLAEVALSRSADIRKKAFGANDSRMIEVYEKQGAFYLARGRYSEAERLYEHAVFLREQDLGSDEGALSAARLMLEAARLGSGETHVHPPSDLPPADPSPLEMDIRGRNGGSSDFQER